MAPAFCSTCPVFLKPGIGIILLLLPHKIPKAKQQRFIKKQLSMVTTEDGELYKSFVISQMTPEERKRAEEARNRKKEHKQSP